MEDTNQLVLTGHLHHLCQKRLLLLVTFKLALLRLNQFAEIKSDPAQHNFVDTFDTYIMPLLTDV